MKLSTMDIEDLINHIKLIEEIRARCLDREDKINLTKQIKEATEILRSKWEKITNE